MSKIARYAGNLRAFGSNAQGLERTVFGENTQADDLTSQVTAAFLRGWGIVGPSENPSMEDFNAAMYTISQFIAYQHQMGVAEWNAEQEYYVGSVCTHMGESYQSLENANIGNEPPSSKWVPVLTSRNGLLSLGIGEGSPIIGSPFPWPNSKMPNELFPSMSGMNFLKSNGASFNKNQYPKLALVYPDLKLTDLRGEFIRGFDDGRGVDQGRSILSAQSDAIRNITGQIAPNDGNSTNIWLGVSLSYSGAFAPASNNAAIRNLSSLPQVSSQLGGINFDASRQVPTASENRPRNIAYNYIVRAA